MNKCKIKAVVEKLRNIDRLYVKYRGYYELWYLTMDGMLGRSRWDEEFETFSRIEFTYHDSLDNLNMDDEIEWSEHKPDLPVYRGRD